ncbi:hypothetical protein DSLASN_28900 [Desulfoluna limicola]|uniref:Uncharacterized protein n=1 Tax=Desulfoluna limicola TaxID=2810562 RepID=A0ABM7PJB4_9BACT|nr:BMA_0021/BMA_0022 family TOMM bacteriocin [Desulfoluna limicola]BCS97258.1 hypothetical protein DSLASN_28900 [Desulfoluna limicola]
MSTAKHLATYDKFLKLRSVAVQAVALAWHDPVFKEAFKEDPVSAMKVYFNYDFPFDIDFIGDKEGREDDYQWNPTGTGGWVGPNNTLELVLPPKPPKGQEALALAAYNANHLTFLTPK